jgi:glycine cleavage system H protein
MPEYIEMTVDKFIFRVATDRLYSKDGIWVLSEDSGKETRVRVGPTDYLQQRNGDVAFVHAKAPGAKLAAGYEFAEVETIKANLSLFSPVAGKIIEINTALEATPEMLNQEPYGKGWVALIEATDWKADRENLLGPQEYFALMRSQAEEELRDS